MPEVVYYVASSLDGYIATADGAVDWLEPFHAGSEDSDFTEFYRSVGALIMGSRTYEVALRLGPWRSPDKPCWVCTSRKLPIAHASITLFGHGPGRLLETLAGKGIERAWLMGGGRLATAFRAEGLISQYVISIIPVLLGGGIALFAGAAGTDALKLTDVKSFPNGVVQLSYQAEATA